MANDSILGFISPSECIMGLRLEISADPISYYCSVTEGRYNHYHIKIGVFWTNQLLLLLISMTLIIPVTLQSFVRTQRLFIVERR